VQFLQVYLSRHGTQVHSLILGRLVLLVVVVFARSQQALRPIILLAGVLLLELAPVIDKAALIEQCLEVLLGLSKPPPLSVLMQPFHLALR
jgi:hypothetical protein